MPGFSGYLLLGFYIHFPVHQNYNNNLKKPSVANGIHFPMMLKSPGKSVVAYLWGWGDLQNVLTKQIERSSAVHHSRLILAVGQVASAVKSRELVLVLSSLSPFYMVKDPSRGNGVIQGEYFFLHELK